MPTFVEFKRPKGDPVLVNVEHVETVREDSDPPGSKARVKVEMVSGNYYTLGDEHTYDRVRQTIDAALRTLHLRPVPL